MGYATFRIEKIKTSHEMTSRYKHNYREYDVSNADGSKSNLNREVIGMNGLTYEQVSDREVKNMIINGYCGRAVRKDAVRGLEVLLSYSQEDKDTVPVDKWIEKSVKWLDKTFNPKDHQIVITDEKGRKKECQSDNLKSVVVHFDETVPHIHAFIVPIDNKGALNANYYTKDRNMLRNMQTDYAKEMEEFGLKRGTRGMKTPHENVSKYYAELEKAVSAELPEVLPGETAQEYRQRANEEFQREKIHHRNDIVKLKQEVKEARADKLNLSAEYYLNEEKTGKQIVKLARELGVPELDDHDVRVIRRDLQQIRDFRKAVENHPDKKETEQLMSSFNMMINWQREQDNKKKKRRHISNDADERNEHEIDNKDE